jgi:electron transfer flavoprotein beta subunit
VTQSLRTALGMGADRAVHVKDAAADGSDSLGTAKILAAVGKAESPDMIFAGFMADDGNFASVGPMLATLLGVPHTTTAVSFAKENGSVRVERELEGGALEVVELTPPCLVTTQTGMNQVRYASLKGIMAAKKKPIDVKSVADLGLAGQVGEAGAKVKIEKIYTPAKSSGAEMLTGSVDEVVGKLVGKIKELGLL